MEWLDWGYWGLFLASFLAASVLPFSSEAVLAGMLAMESDPWMAVGVATLGNWLGGLSTYWVGHLGKWEWIEKYMRVEREKVLKWKPKIDRYGSIFAVISFVPVIGDAIAVALGFFRANVWLTGFWMFIGKLSRYLAVLWGMNLL